ncbi:MAG: type IV pilus secretin PilQ [Candidatus Eisenbacteria bacterium]|nr:type IV pilus secretin PilQ [Candidatus Eisenbacteria bacterium]
MHANRVVIGLLLAAGLVLATGVEPAGAQSSASSQVGLTRTSSGGFNLDVTGADLRTVLRAISEFSGRNIVVSQNVKATVTIQLRNVAWQDALKAVLRANGLDFVEDGSVVRVDESGKLNTEKVERETANARTLELVPLETRIVKLNYANANEMTTPLAPALSKRGSIQVEKRTNSLIVTDLTSNLDAVVKMALELDSTTPQIEITAKLVDVDASALRNLGVEWNIAPQKPEFWAGVDDGSGGKKLQGGGPLHNDDYSLQVGAEHNTGVEAANKITFGIFKDWASIEAQLQSLEEKRKANIISNPRITTVDNREAKIIVGQKIPLIVQDVAGNPVSQLQTIGIQLKVTPHLTQDKKIVMDLHPEVSDLSTQSTVQGGIIINTSEADTRVMVDDGQTAVIGGLIRTNESTVTRGVPFLKDIPLVSFLFSSHSTVRQNRELIIFVTPRIVTNLASN